MRPYMPKHNRYNRRSKVDFTIFFRLLSESASQCDSSDALMVLEPAFYEPVYNTQVLLSPKSLLLHSMIAYPVSCPHIIPCTVHPPVLFWFVIQTNRAWLLHASFTFMCIKMSAFNLFEYDCIQGYGMVFGEDGVYVCVCVWADLPPRCLH